MADCTKPRPVKFGIRLRMQSQYSSHGSLIRSLITITEIKNVLHNSKWKCNLRLFLLVLSLGTAKRGMTSSSLFPSIIRHLWIDKISPELSLLQDKPSQPSQCLMVCLMLQAKLKHLNNALLDSVCFVHTFVVLGK